MPKDVRKNDARNRERPRVEGGIENPSSVRAEMCIECPDIVVSRTNCERNQSNGIDRQQTIEWKRERVKS